MEKGSPRVLVGSHLGVAFTADIDPGRMWSLPALWKVRPLHSVALGFVTAVPSGRLTVRGALRGGALRRQTHLVRELYSIFGDSVAGFSVSSVTVWFNSRPHHRVTEDTEAHVRERNHYAEYKKAPKSLQMTTCGGHRPTHSLHGRAIPRPHRGGPAGLSRHSLRLSRIIVTPEAGECTW
jgi:hypothetical protein